LIVKEKRPEDRKRGFRPVLPIIKEGSKKTQYSSEPSKLKSVSGKGFDALLIKLSEKIAKYSGSLQKSYLKEIPKRTVCVFNPLSVVSNGSEIW
jgi:hypothetical protein